MLADLHCHYPMHLVGGDEHDPTLSRMTRRRDRAPLNKLRALLVELFAEKINDPSEREGDWRVNLDRLERGGVKVACSVLYDPFSEIDLGKWWQGARPDDDYFDALIEQIELVERNLDQPDHRDRRVIVRNAADLDGALAGDRIAFVHCVEGGFHLGRSVDKVDARVAELARRGVGYVTLAHLFWRRVATNAPALPFLPEWLYPRIFCQPKGAGLSDIGVAAVRAMYAHRVLVDVSHMRADALAQTFALLDELDGETGADPTAFPVIASHGGYRFGEQSYMLDDDTIRAIAARDGVIGLILARHQLEDGLPGGEGLPHTIEIVRRHVDKLVEVAGSIRHVAIGTDLDGFIKPTMGGVEYADDLAPFADAVRETYPADADALLRDNAVRVLRAVLAGRG